jgi:NAD(P)-dependent dehydrogenase (short-subunit alcohol dehydrogenase family)
MDTSKVILIGGVTGGIGSALATRLTKQGHTVVGFSRKQSDDAGSAHEHLVCDATNSAEVSDLFAKVHESHGKIDAYVHAIGSIFLKPAHLTSEEDWLLTLHQNLSSAFYGLRSATKFMTKQGSGSCLFFSTAAAQVGLGNHEAIAAAKGGIEAMVRSAASTYANRGVRVNAIAPSLTDTPLAKSITSSEQALEFSKKMHPLGEIGNADHVASLAQWLLSEEARFVTGQTYVMDGGLSTIVPKPKV